MPGALDGINVLDFTRYQQGTYGTCLLGDLGANILKVEQPGGDPGRRLGMHEDGFSSYFEVLNRNKRSIGLDLGRPGARELALRLAADADVVVENFRPGTMDRLGLGYDDVVAVNPAIVYASGSMFGPEGERGRDPGFDPIALSAGGIVSWLSRNEGHPKAPQPGSADQTGGAMLAVAILGALVCRLRTGVGQKVDVSLYGSQIAIQGIHFARGLHSSPVRPRGKISSSLYHTALCNDGLWIQFGYLDGRYWPDFCRGLDLTHLESEERFATAEARGENMVELTEIIDAQVVQAPAADWIDKLRAAGIPCTVIQDYEMIANDPQAQANGYVLEQEHPVWGRIRTIGTVASLSETPPRVVSHAPIHPGDDTRAILDEAGLSAQEIDGLMQSGAVFGSD